jgi:PAS domain S-box-containing protein
MGSRTQVDAPAPAPRGSGSLIDRIRYALPHGQGLPEGDWRQRHKALLVLVFFHALAIPLFGISQGYGVIHSASEGGIVAILGAIALFTKERKPATAFVSLALLTSSALIVHFSRGAIEAHFHFFVMVVVLTLYEDWMPFLLAVTYVAIHHGVGGVLDASSVYNHEDAVAHPWKWAGIHAGFIAAAGLAAIAAWRLNEDVRHRLTAIVESSSDAIVTKGLDGTILSWNSGAEEIYGHSADEAIGQSMDLVLAPHRRAEEREIFARAREGEGVEDYETERVRTGGQIVDVSLTVSPIRDATGRIIGTSTIARDISERKRAEEDLKAAREEADRLKQEFFELVSHDLRTPLASIKGYSELLAGGAAGDLPVKAKQFIEVIERNTGRLERLVGDLLFAAQLDAGRFTFENDEVDLTTVVMDCVEAAVPRAEEEGIDLNVESHAGVHCRGDAGRLGQLLDNLISNAIKYTPEGGKVMVALEHRDGEAIITVQDTGMGIPEQEQEFLFNRFFRSSGAISNAIPGVGLGLTIVKAIAEAHGGTVAFDSKERLGTQFWVKLPEATVSEQAAVRVLE